MFAPWRLNARLEASLMEAPMGTVEWFIVGGIIVGALDQLIEYSPWKSNNMLQVLLEGLKTIFRTGSK